MAEKAGMSTGTKIAMGVAGAVGAAVIGAATFGGGYVIYKNVKGKQQDASPLQLHILVKNAKNLKDEDTFGESDPYVVVEVDDVKKRTKTVENNHSPTWNEELTIGVFEEHMDTNIVFGVWDDDHGSEYFPRSPSSSHTRKVGIH
eukprot:TRINITY_DN278_c0_g1_i1.p1 TRINITY_DN278_c0_g1~~TRINITY_DN278_c0_g1_i1.p1  ORF type:complete len:165 (-),score=57.74 TRINITY_DN278_c0_g1_i1:580-1014(-)